jgi:hypothetical protein
LKIAFITTVMFFISLSQVSANETCDATYMKCADACDAKDYNENCYNECEDNYYSCVDAEDSSSKAEEEEESDYLQ